MSKRIIIVEDCEDSVVYVDGNVIYHTDETPHELLSKFLVDLDISHGYIRLTHDIIFHGETVDDLIVEDNDMQTTEVRADMKNYFNGIYSALHYIAP